MLHLGVQRVDDLRRLPAALLAPLDLKVRLGGFGKFSLGNGRTNHHIRVEPRGPLVAAQQALIRASTSLCTERFSLYVGPRFVPHVTVWDQAGAGPSLAGALEKITLPEEEFRLSDLLLIGRLPS
jgi:hypothetical protein